MLFTSFTFLFAFFPVVLVLWWALRRPAWRLVFLALASYFFYAWYDWRYLPLLWLTTLVDFGAGRVISASADRPRRRRLALVVAIVINLSALGFFKYANFFLDSLQGVATWFGVHHPLPTLHILLPLGISFYTFSSLSSTVDIYRGAVQPPKNLLQYAVFVAMFPRLLAGPIARFGDMDRQLRELQPRLTSQMAASGLFFVACGLAKKLLVADILAPYVDDLFTAHDKLGLLSGWAAAIGYTLQLYFDFSGYSDTATGLALLLGFRLPQNFNSPYKAVNASDFWRRWHMTLSYWLRDYLFIPFGGSRHGMPRTVRNLMLTFLLGGLWHGAGWTFVLWGGMHGFYQSVHAVLRKKGLTPHSVIFNRAVTFLLVAVAWVPFRAPSISVTGSMFASMIGAHGLDSTSALGSLVGLPFALMLGAALVFVNAAPNTWEITLTAQRRYAVVLGLLLAVSILFISQPLPFLYFKF